MDADAQNPARWRLIAGLGNPGKQYANTRHNVGFQLLDRLAEKHELRFDKMLNRGIAALGSIADQRVILIKPQTFMNVSGECIAPTAKYYKCELQDVLIVYDELDLPQGRLRMRPSGSAGGHNGIKSIITRMGGQDFPRLRVGIGRPPGRMDSAAYVLQPFTSSEKIEMNETYDRAIDGIERWLRDGIEKAMNVVNINLAPSEQ
jgi:PTH1 family peptidyl-tRNA hydrolase